MVTVGRRAYDLLYRLGAPWEGADRVELRALVRDGRCAPAALRGPDRPSARAVDLGCGSGGVAVELAEAGFAVTGVDFSEVALRKARDRAADHGLGPDRVRFVRGDLTTGAIDGVDGPFDLLVDYGTLDDLPDGSRDAMAALVARLARPGARMFLFAFSGAPRDLPRFSFGGPSRAFPGLLPGEVERRFGSWFRVESLDPPTPTRHVGTWLLERTDTPAPAALVVAAASRAAAVGTVVPGASTGAAAAAAGLEADPGPALHRAGTLLLVSGVLAAVGLVFLAGMYAAFGAGASTAGMALGWLNDSLAIAQLVLLVPGILAIHRLLRRTAPRASGLLAGIAIASTATVGVLQGLLVTGVLTFEQQVGPVLLAYAPLAAWFVLTGRMGGAAGVVPGGARTGALGASYLGYPVWAFRVGRRLRAAGRGWHPAASAEQPARASRPGPETAGSPTGGGTLGRTVPAHAAPAEPHDA